MVAVLYQDRDGGSQGPAQSHTGQKAGPIDFDGHPPTAAIPLLASRQIVVDILRSKGESCGDPLQQAHLSRPMGLTGGAETEMGHQRLYPKICCPSTSVSVSLPWSRVTTLLERAISTTWT